MGPCFPGCDSDSSTLQGKVDYPRMDIERRDGLLGYVGRF
jgi:hypothetical protein